MYYCNLYFDIFSGVQKQIIHCIRKETGNVVAFESCAGLPKPASEVRVCNDYCVVKLVNFSDKLLFCCFILTEFNFVNQVKTYGLTILIVKWFCEMKIFFKDFSNA